MIGRSSLKGRPPSKRNSERGQSPDYFDALCMAICSDGVISFDTELPAEQICF